jgi:hypothetical protein
MKARVLPAAGMNTFISDGMAVNMVKDAFPLAEIRFFR